MKKKNEEEEGKKIFVLDTSVLLHDPSAIFSFGQNMIVIPLTVIEELDNKKNGDGAIPFAARSVLRLIDQLMTEKNTVTNWTPIEGGGMIKVDYAVKPHKAFTEGKRDDLIISTAVKNRESNKKKVVLISKDSAMRIKAGVVGIEAEDYLKDKSSLFKKYGNILYEGDYKNGIFSTRYSLDGKNLFRISGENSATQIERKKELSILRARNIEQRCALDALMCPEIEIMAITGPAGTGKTILALAAALKQVIGDKQLFEQIIVARPPIPAGYDQGFLPGTIEEKLEPWMGPIFSNLEILVETLNNPKAKNLNLNGKKDIPFKNYNYLIANKLLQIESLAHIQGKSLPKRFILIDESQNLTPRDMKTIVTRCGEGTKIVFTGDLQQINVNYLDQESSGLSFLIQRFINEPEFCYLDLKKTVRSSLAEKAARLL